MRKMPSVIAGLCFIPAVLAFRAEASTVVLQFDSLPSAQGWTFVPYGWDASRTELGTFSLSGGVLTQNTLGYSLSGSSSTHYERPLPMSPDLPYTVTWRARVTANEGDTGAPLYGYGFVILVGNQASSVMIGISTDRIRDHAFQTAFHDATTFHDYQIVADPLTGYELFVDGGLVMAGGFFSTFADTLALGDWSGVTNAVAEVTQYDFDQPDAAGRVDQLTVALEPNGDVTLSWSASCLLTADDFAVYQGVIKAFASRSPVSCTTQGATAWTFPPQAANSYYLVVPTNELKEGSYGRDSAGAERLPAPLACAPQNLGTCPAP